MHLLGSPRLLLCRGRRGKRCGVLRLQDALGLRQGPLDRVALLTEGLNTLHKLGRLRGQAPLGRCRCAGRVILVLGLKTRPKWGQKGVKKGSKKG